jgi:hypothetical protein
MEKQTSCKQRVRKELRDRISDLRKLFSAYRKGNEEAVEDLGTFPEYGLSFDYVAPNTFDDQKRGYFRYQLSWGGPADEFRFYCDENFQPVEIEYWFLDWFDDAGIDLSGEDYQLLEEIFEDFKDIGLVETEYAKARED